MSTREYPRKRLHSRWKLSQEFKWKIIIFWLVSSFLVAEICTCDTRLQSLLHFHKFSFNFLRYVSNLLTQQPINFWRHGAWSDSNLCISHLTNYFHTLLLLSPSLWPLSQLEPLQCHSILVVIKYQENYLCCSRCKLQRHVAKALYCTVPRLSRQSCRLLGGRVGEGRQCGWLDWLTVHSRNQMIRHLDDYRCSEQRKWGNSAQKDRRAHC